MYKWEINESIEASLGIYSLNELIGIVLIRKVQVKDNSEVTDKIYGFLQSYEEERVEEFRIDGSTWTYNRVASWNVVENVNARNWRDAKSKEDKDKWITKVDINLIKHIEITEEQYKKVNFSH